MGSSHSSYHIVLQPSEIDCYLLHPLRLTDIKCETLVTVAAVNTFAHSINRRKIADNSDGNITYALNTVFIDELNKWIRLDARGNKENVHAEFSLDEERSAFPICVELSADHR